jgi:serine/threonine protein kinase
VEPEDVPERIGRYEVIQHLASGGMADLFLCRQSGPSGFEKVVALKQIRSEYSADDEFLTMFMDEARIAALLNHPNIAQIYELGSESGQPFLAMEFVNGRSLSAIYKKTLAQGQTVPAPIVAAIMVGILRGLSYAHQRKTLSGEPLNLVHRDVTPQNVLISNDGQIKLVDFGIAKASNQVARTRHGVLKGKYSYMSPEQVRSQPLDGRSDLFAVGILMYEALTAQRPFKRGNTVDTLKAVISELPADPRRYNAALAKPIVEIVARALFKRRSKRYANADQMLQALERELHRQDDPVTPAVIASWVDDLFRADEGRAERTIILQDVGELLLPEAVSSPSSLDIDFEDDSGIPEKTVISMLDEIPGEETSGLSGSISVDLGAQLSTSPSTLPDALDNSATVPHIVQFEARLDDSSDELADDRTQISAPPLAVRLSVERQSESPTSLPTLAPESAGYRVDGGLDLPPRPGLEGLSRDLKSGLIEDLSEHRLTLFKFMALGVGIGAVLLIGLILVTK